MKLSREFYSLKLVESSWSVMTHGDARKRKWRGNWRKECVAIALHTTSEHGASSITNANAHPSAASSRLNWRPDDLNGLVRFAERRNLVSGRLPLHFKRSLPSYNNNEINKLYTYTVKHNNVFLTLFATRFGQYDHHQVNIVQKCNQGCFFVIQSNSCTIHTLKHNHFNI